MIVIADTTPLISLMKIGRLDLIFHLFGEIMIPKAVFDELVYNSRFPEESRQMKESSFIKTVVVEDIKSVNYLGDRPDWMLVKVKQLYYQIN